MIPAFVPAQQNTPAVIEVALRDAPVLPDAVATDALPAPVAEPVVAAPATPQVKQAIAPRTATPTVKPKQRVQVAKPASRAKARAPRHAQPVIVAQAPAFTAPQPSSLQPDWVIGVYR
ncbi:hypothetical protein [Tateyamaria sp. SN6-1]|uniref:hypothetical protein n=1 Tax=Tateyamaria sp. SN6-1 TaxID=3092148 RepID=UPI0039F55647